MATSPIYSWPEPDNTDLVKNGALAIRTLGNAIDTTMGTMVAKTIIDAKGDVIAGTAADTAARLAVGNNGETLVADSSAATGLKWAKSANFVGCAVYATAAQSIATGTYTAVTFNAENYDTDAFHDNSTNNSRLTIPTGLGGYYLVNTTQRWNPNTGFSKTLQLYKNGSAIYTMDTGSGVGGYPTFSKSNIVKLNAGDYIQCFVYQPTGSALDFFGRDEEQPFSIQFLGAQ